MKFNNEMREMLLPIYEGAFGIANFCVYAINELREAETMKERFTLGFLYSLVFLAMLTLLGMGIFLVIHFLLIIFVLYILKAISFICKEVYKLWRKANAFMVLPPYAEEVVQKCITNIFCAYPHDFPVAGSGNGILNQVRSAVYNRAGFQYIRLDVVKNSVKDLNDTERKRIKILLQRYIDELLYYNAVDGIPQVQSAGGMPYLTIDEVTGNETNMQIDVLWVSHSNVENYIRNKNNFKNYPVPNTKDGDF